MMNLEIWTDFCRGERVDNTPSKPCTECGKPAECYASWDDGSGDICEKCCEEQKTS